MSLHQPIIDLIKRSSTFLIASHAHPDGDGIGSTIALGKGMETLGKKVIVFNADGVPLNLRFLPHSDEVVNKLDLSSNFDATIFVDCSEASRVEGDFVKLAPKNRGVIARIDHHSQTTGDADIECVDKNAAATGEVVFELLKTAGVKITKDIATLIFTTLVVDTGSFRYSNTTPKLLKLAAELMEHGADPWEISMALDESSPPEQLKLLSLALSTVNFALDGQMAYMILTQQMFMESGASVEAAEEFINFPRSIARVRVAILFREMPDGRWKISFRSKDDVDVSAIAASFGGGGHQHAAGCTLTGSLGAVRETIFKAVEIAL